MIPAGGLSFRQAFIAASAPVSLNAAASAWSWMKTPWLSGSGNPEIGRLAQENRLTKENAADVYQRFDSELR